jgi:hypothetical protein
MSDEREDQSLDREDQLLRDLARDYNEPPATPREGIWTAVEARLGRERRSRRWRAARSPWLWLPAAAAAALFMGIMIGRDSLRQEAEQAVAEYRQELAAENAKALFELAAGPTLNRAELLLTQYRSASPGDPMSGRVGPWAGGLLMQTRLLLDSPAAEDPELRRLLEDLELVLARIKQATGSGLPADRESIKQGIEDRDLLLRLRAWIPAGAPVDQGA